MKQYNLCFLGFGNVGRALARLLALKSGELREQYGIEFKITGVASRRIGWLRQSQGKHRSFTGRASTGQLAFHGLHEFFDNAEAESG